MASHSHSHSHGHAPSASADRRWLTLALVLILGFMVVEVVAGLLASSVALLSDAAHMLTDAGSLALALGAASLAARPPSRRYTFGLGRAEVLSAQVNGAALLLLAGVLAFESVRRLLDPGDVEGAIVVAVGGAGALVNVGAAWALSRSERRSLNVEGALAHVRADLYASLAAAASGLVVLLTDWARADAVAALVVVGLMVRSGFGLLREATHVLLEGAPSGLEPQEVGAALAAHPCVQEVHDLHLWEVTSGFPALSAHVLVGERDDCHEARLELESLLRERFGLTHTTLQVDHTGRSPLLQIGPRA